MKQVFLRYLLVPHLVLSVLVCLCAAALLGVLQVQVWSGTAQRHAELQAENRALKRDLAQVRARANLSEQARTTKDILATLDDQLTTPLTQSELVSEISTLVRRSNITLLHSDNRTDTRRDGIIWLRQEVTLEGEYAAVRYFLQLVGASKHLTLIEEVDWKRGKGTRQKIRISLATLLRQEA